MSIQHRLDKKEAPPSLRRPMAPHSSQLRKGRFSQPHRIYHVTKRLQVRWVARLTLSAPEHASIIVQAMEFQQSRHGCDLLAFVIMPDHFHWLFALGPNEVLSDRVKVLCNWSATLINRQLGRTGAFWQNGFYDHLIRPQEKVFDHIAYIEANPVRAGLCSFVHDWAWSSAHAQWSNIVHREMLGPML